jgi:FkbH-like protein/FkbM family methyltransferase
MSYQTSTVANLLLDTHATPGATSEAPSWDIHLDMAAFPYLTDHGFQGMTVLPGSFYVELALAGGAALAGDAPQRVRDIVFENVFLLAADSPRAMRMTITPQADGTLQVSCHDIAQGTGQPTRYARLTIPAAEGFAASASAAPAPEAVQARCSEQMSGSDLYAAFARNGNQYGPLFQSVAQFWRGEHEALAQVRMPAALEAELLAAHLHPVLLDACVQTFASINNTGRTFVLVGFEEVRRFDLRGSQFWAHAVIEHEDGGAPVGTVQLLTEDGQVALELRGLRINYLEGAREEDDAARATLAVAATFTAEPVEESLAFWGRELGTPLKVEFAHYNQVFQQLLDTSSLFARNEQGMNVVLLRFEDWVRHHRALALAVEPEEKERLLAQHDRYTLPNRLEIAHLNQYETEYVYKEIFVDQSYNKHGISFQDGDTVIDIGANIGLFTLWMLQQCKDPTIYSFEPSPPVYQLLATNANLYGKNVHPLNYGISDCTKEATFTFYRKSSVFSSFAADTEEDAHAIRAVVENMLRESVNVSDEELDAFVDELMADRMESTAYTCQLRSISDMIREHHIQKIDLLKIDAEKSEQDILRGIDDEHWPMIKQIVMEVHDQEGPIIRDVLDTLRGRGFEVAMEEEYFLHNSGLYNIFATREQVQPAAEQPAPADTRQRTIQENVESLSLAMRGAAERSAVPYLVVVCPPSPAELADPAQAVFYQQMEDLLASNLAQASNTYMVRSAELAATYPVAEYYDAEGDTLGHVPYTHSFFAALGSMIARKFHTTRRAPYKVIVLDCDNTLWNGVCGEDGPQGIGIDEARAALQTFMVRQHDAGMLLCLCSKNTEEDVYEVFAQRDDMPLTREHVVTSRINWQPKSANLRELAEELQLGLDSFIFIDDNPVECAEVRANCPEVLVLPLPEDTTTIPRFLDHVWAFDHLKITEEDRSRTSMYQQNIQREKARSTSLTLTDFLAELNIQVRIAPPTPAQLPRVSQLTQRTNQFNFTTIRRSEAEIQRLCQGGERECRVVEVSDRFGDYGLVGVMLFELTPEALALDTMLLSCRVLGRGVEHQMLAHLGQVASERQRASVDIRYLPTRKNQPALDFLTSVVGDYQESAEEGLLFRVPTEFAQHVTYTPAESAPPADANGESKPRAARAAASAVDAALLERFVQIANTLYDAEQVLGRASARQVQQRSDTAGVYVAPGSDLEQSIAAVWQEVLGLERVGSRDNFFEIGGTSLKGVQLIAQLKQRLGVELSIVNLFESPTIGAMAAMLGTNGSSSAAASEQARASRERGERRRAQRSRRRS